MVHDGAAVGDVQMLRRQPATADLLERRSEDAELLGGSRTLPLIALGQRREDSFEGRLGQRGYSIEGGPEIVGEDAGPSHAGVDLEMEWDRPRQSAARFQYRRERGDRV